METKTPEIFKVILLKRDKHLISITKPNDKGCKTKLRYNLKIKQMEKYYPKERAWIIVNHQYEFFRDYRISHIQCEEEHFRKLIEKSKKLNSRCTSLSSFIVRLHEAIVYENYIVQGIKAECYIPYSYDRYSNRKILTKPLEFYNKNMIKFFKKHDIEVTRRLENSFEGDYSFYNLLIQDLENLDIEDEIKGSFFEGSLDDYGYPLNELIKEYNYNQKSLIKYLVEYLMPFENIRPTKSVELLRDYYQMANKIGRNVKKYPKYLRSMHDIITANYNAFKKEYDELTFEKLMKPELEQQNKMFSIVVPKTSKEIISEGTTLNHCVGSYIDRILKKQTYIFFLRLTEAPEQSLLTLELRENRLVNAKGSYNRLPTKIEKQFLVNYCKKKKLAIGI